MTDRPEVDLSIGTLGGAGALDELLAEALPVILQNIHDPRTDPEAAREILFRVTFKPDKNRYKVNHTATVAVKLAATKFGSAIGEAFTGRRSGHLAIVTYDIRQAGIFDGDVKPDPTVKDISEGRKAREGAQ